MKKFSILGVLVLLIATMSVTLAQTPKSVSLQMKAVEGSKVVGTAVVSESGTGTKVVVNLTGYAANQGSAGHIHTGTCEKQGAVVFPLTTITANAQGAGTAETTLANAPYATVTNGNHYVQYHEAAQPAGKQVSCANIVAAGQGGGTPTAPATGFGSAEGQGGLPTGFLLAAMLLVLVSAGAGYAVVRQRGK